MGVTLMPGSTRRSLSPPPVVSGSTPIPMNPPPNRYSLTTVSIVDGNEAFRSALVKLLVRCPGVVIFDQCADAATARVAVMQRPPRVLLVGDDLADAPGWQ